MVAVLLRLIKFPDGRFLASGIPLMLAGFLPPEEARFMHPLVRATSEDKGLLFPDAAARKVETSISKCSAEVKALGVCMKDVDRSVICH